MAETKLLLKQLNIVARDFDATLAFYRRLGLDVPDGHSGGESEAAARCLDRHSQRLVFIFSGTSPSSPLRHVARRALARGALAINPHFPPQSTRAQPRSPYRDRRRHRLA